MRRLLIVLTAGAVLLAAPAGGVLAPVAASADPAVVSATIYAGRPAGISAQTVTAGALSSCPAYSGASPFLLRPGDTPYQPAVGGSWSLATIVECGLQIPRASLTDVAVQSTQHGFETPLSPAELTDAGRYADPTAPGALPVISLDGGQNQVSYARPERSPSDANAADAVSGPGPVTIAVYENAPPLTVRASARRLSVNATALRVRLAATVTDAAGHAPAPTELSWSWSLGDGTAAGQATPTHAFPLGRWFVTVVVTDRASGTAGTDTIPVSVDAHALAGSADRAGAGKRRTSSSPSGVVKGAGATGGPGRTRPRTRRPSPVLSQPSAGGHATTTGTTPAPAHAPPASAPPAPTTTSETSTTPAATPAPAAHERRPAGRHRPRLTHRNVPQRVTRARVPGGGRIVRGLLIADVTPVARAVSPLTHAAPVGASAAAVVRAATHASSGLGGFLAAAVILTLLALGAGREHRSRP